MFIALLGAYLIAQDAKSTRTLYNELFACTWLSYKHVSRVAHNSKLARRPHIVQFQATPMVYLILKMCNSGGF